MSVEKETITLHRDGTALTSKPPGTHIEKEYSVISDTTHLTGRRVVVLEEKDLTAQREKARKLAEAIAEKVGEGESKAFKDLLFDIFRDYYEKTIDKLYKAVVEGKPIRVREGCLKITIGDARRSDSEEIMLRE